LPPQSDDGPDLSAAELKSSLRRANIHWTTPAEVTPGSRFKVTAFPVDRTNSFGFEENRPKYFCVVNLNAADLVTLTEQHAQNLHDHGFLDFIRALEACVRSYADQTAVESFKIGLAGPPEAAVRPLAAGKMRATTGSYYPYKLSHEGDFVYKRGDGSYMWT
jgi:hypothetical protein